MCSHQTSEVEMRPDEEVWSGEKNVERYEARQNAWSYTIEAVM